jgi:hypothetical protein
MKQVDYEWTAPHPADVGLRGFNDWPDAQELMIIGLPAVRTVVQVMRAALRAGPPIVVG